MKNSFVLLLFFTLFFDVRVLAGWDPTNGPYGGSVWSVETFGRYLFVGACPGGIYASADSGRTWSKRNNGIQTGTQCVVALFHHENEMYAGVSDYGIFKSLDTGLTWVSVDNGMHEYYIKHIGMVDSTLFIVTEDGILYKSLDHAATWTNIPVPNSPYIRCILTRDSTIYFGTDMGIYFTSDFGMHWTISTAGLVGTNVVRLRFKGNELYSSTFDGIFKSMDFGHTWDTVIVSPFIGTLFEWYGNRLFSMFNSRLSSSDSTIYFTPSDQGLPDGYSVRELFSYGSLLFVSLYGRGIYLSADSGSTWYESNTGFAATNVTGVVKTDSSLYVSTYGSGVYTSTDGGNSWKNISKGLTSPLISSIEAKGMDIFVGNYNSMLRMHERDTVWTNITDSIPFWNIQDVNDFMVRGNSIYALVSGRIFKSTTNGNSWIQVSSYGFPIGVMAANDTAYYFTQENTGAVFYSSDEFQTWTRILQSQSFNTIMKLCLFDSLLLIGTHSSFEAAPNFSQLIQFCHSNGYFHGVHEIEPYDDHIFLLDDTLGVVYTDRRGNSCYTLNDGLEDLIGSSIYIDRSSNSVYLGTKTNSVYRSDLSLITNTASSPVHSPEILLYPNPVSNTLYVSTSSSIDQVKISIYNIEGKQIYKSERESLFGTLGIEMTHFPKGIYIIKFNSEKIDYKKVFLLE